MQYSDADLKFLRRSLTLAKKALELGDEPFGSVLVDASGNELFADHNRVSGGDATRHPEFEISRWAAKNLTPEERAASTVYTSGEHCPMCAASHAWVGLGKIYYVTSAKQLAAWLREWNIAPAPVASLSITEIAPSIQTFGPANEFAEESKALYYKAFVERFK